MVCNYPSLQIGALLRVKYLQAICGRGGSEGAAWHRAASQRACTAHSNPTATTALAGTAFIRFPDIIQKHFKGTLESLKVVSIDCICSV